MQSMHLNVCKVPIYIYIYEADMSVRLSVHHVWRGGDGGGWEGGQEGGYNGEARGDFTDRMPGWILFPSNVWSPS